jgi:hypothetical protein
LTVILGGRSTGKTYTLNEIDKAFECAKYIRQFALLELDEGKASNDFDKDKKTDKSTFVEEYLHEFKQVEEDIEGIDLESDDDAIEEYIKSLTKHASERYKADVYSSSYLYNPDTFTARKLDSLTKLIDAVMLLLESDGYRTTIDKYLTRQPLVDLLLDLVRQYRDGDVQNKKCEWVNCLSGNITRALQQKSADTPIAAFHPYNILLNRAKVERFSELCRVLRAPKSKKIADIGKYKIVAEIQQHAIPQELRNQSGKRDITFSSAFAQYNDPYRYLLELKQIDGLPSADRYKYFVKIDYKIKNPFDLEVSGGERAEFNLLKNIQDARKHEILLIDEPESSFDNLFLRDGVNSLIKEISSGIPVVVVTHNNTVGASIKADYVLFTKRDTSNGTPVFSVFEGYPGDKELHDGSGNTIRNYKAQIDSLEAGESSYDDRRSMYEALKN